MALSLALETSILLSLAFLGYVLAARLGQAAVVGLLAVGFVVGPSVLNVVHYDVLVRDLAELGAIVLLFAIGMETSYREILRPRYAIIALVGVLVPWGAGYGAALVWGYPGAESILVGTALAATSIAITANVLKQERLLQEPFARAIVGAAVVDDVLSLLLLTISVQLGNGGLDALAVGILAAKALAFLVVGIPLGTRIVNPLLRRLDQAAYVQLFPELVFVAAMAVAFVYAAAAEEAGLSAILGAFVAGTVLEDVRLDHGRSFQEGAEYLHAIFASIFFLSLGVLVDLTGFEASAAVFTLVLILVAVVTKLVGCGVPARFLGYTNRESLLVGLGMVPRGEVAMIVALLGLEAGVIERPVFAILVLMALITTIITPPVLRRIAHPRTVATDEVAA